MTKKKEKDLEAILEEHLTSGKFFVVGDIRTFYLDQGKGEVVLCVHGGPTSSFLYRKVLKALKKKGYRAICIDLPGLGLSDRPEEFKWGEKILLSITPNTPMKIKRSVASIL